MSDENLLIAKAQSGDSDAENELLIAYSPLVKAIARSYNAIGVDVDDLIQSGMIGLMNAVRKYNIEEGTASFKTYAFSCIHNAIRNTLRKQNRTSKEDTPLSEIMDMPSKIDVLNDYLDWETARLLMSAISSVLTESEMDVLKLYICAIPYKEISEKLGIEQKKVDNTIYSLKKKIKKLLENNNNLK